MKCDYRRQTIRIERNSRHEAAASPITAARVFAAVAVTLLAGSPSAFAQPTIVSATGYSITFNGNQQAFFSNTWDGTSQQTPNNISLSAQGSTAFASSQFGGSHQTAYANDGVYGNNRSWLTSFTGTQAFVGITFPAAQSLSSIAWGRDNGRNSTATPSGGGDASGGSSGQFSDRAAGTYSLQFTTVATPNASTPNGSWTTIGSVTLSSTAAGGFIPWFRHEYDVRTSSGQPIAGVTGFRIVNSWGGSIEQQIVDEIEVYRHAWWTGGSAVWSSTTAWQTAASGGTSTTPFAGDSVVFAQNTLATQAVTLGSDQATRALSFTTADPVAITAGGSNGTLALGWAGNLTTSSTASSVTMNVAAGAGAVTIGSQTAGEQVALSLNASQTWTNDSSNTLTIRNAVSRVSSDTTSRVLTVEGSGNTTIASGVSNGGVNNAGNLGITKSGAGTLTLAGNNSFTGPVTINSGTLQFGDGGASDGLAGAIVNNGALVINLSNDAHFSGGISGTGTVIQSGAGGVTFTGSSGLTGAIVVSAGVMNARGPSALGNGNVQVDALGRLNVNPYGGTVANNMTLNGGEVSSLVVSLPSGGSHSTTPDGLYGLNTFTTGSDSFSGYTGSVDVLVVGGGGGGGSRFGGGGGAGGVVYQTGVSLNGAPITVTVGSGGAGGATTGGTGAGGATTGGNGQNSVFGSIVAYGGGGGAAGDTGNGLAGGSGGGAAGRFAGTGGSGTSSQGFAGGSSTGVSPYVGGGGGGAGGAGSVSGTNGAGGIGRLIPITGSDVYYGGGGGGGGSGDGNRTGGTGGLGGGGNGGDYTGTPAAVAGTANTGGGGGGGAFLSSGANRNQAGAAGGSGVVIVRYLLPSNGLTVMSGSVTVNATSTLDAVRGSGGLRFTGAMSGAGGLTIDSTGSGAVAKVIFDGAAKSYAGPTVINAGGDLRVNSDNSLATGAVTVNGRLGGSGSLRGAVTVNSGGVLSPGNSIESLSTGSVSFAGGSTYEYEVDSSAALSVGADFTKALGNLSLSGSVTLSLIDLAASPTEFANGTTFSLFNYTGSWNNGLFTVSGSQVADEGTFTFGLNTWRLDYNASTGGSNYSSEYTAGNFVNIVAVPEPGAIALAGIGIAAALALRRRK